MRPDIDGEAVMAHLGIGPGRAVGEALAMLLEARLEDGPLGEDEAYRRLDEWWAARQQEGAPIGAPVAPRPGGEAAKSGDTEGT